MRWAASLVLLFSATAVAQERASARISYSAEEGLGCPEQAAFRDIVAARLGYDPFREDAAREIDARIERNGRRLRGRVKVLNDKGRVVGSRELTSAESECAELASSLAIAVSILLDPFAATGTAAPKPPPPAPPPAPPPKPVEKECPKPVEPADPARIFGAGYLGASLGLTPGLSLGPSVATGITWSRLSIGILGRADFTPVSVKVDNGERVVAAVYSAGPRSCFAPGFAIACLGVQAGVFQGRGIDLDKKTQTGRFLSTDVTAGPAIPLGATTRLEILAELRAPVSRTSLLIDGETVWTAPPIVVGLRIGVSAAFPPVAPRRGSRSAWDHAARRASDDGKSD